jgi:hypothetical protein
LKPPDKLWIVPLTVKGEDGVVVPIPTLPLFWTMPDFTIVFLFENSEMWFATPPGVVTVMLVGVTASPPL